MTAIEIIDSLITLFQINSDQQTKFTYITNKEYQPVVQGFNHQIVQLSRDTLFYKDSNYILQISASKSYVPTQHNILDLQTDEKKVLWCNYFDIPIKENKEKTNETSIGPKDISEIFMNESNTECVLNVDVIISISGNCMSTNKFPILFTNIDKNGMPKLTNFKKQIALKNCDKIIGYIGDTLIKIGNNHNQYQYFDKYKSQWIECNGMPQNQYIDASYVFILKLPQNNMRNIMKYAIVTKICLYGFDIQLNKFIPIPIIDKETKRDVILHDTCGLSRDAKIKSTMFNERLFYILSECLYEIEWAVSENNNQPMLFSSKHLAFNSYFQDLYDCGKYGIALTMKPNNNAYSFSSSRQGGFLSSKQEEKKQEQHIDNGNWIDKFNDYLIIYNPVLNSIIYRLKQNDINLQQICDMKDISIQYALWLNDIQSLMLIINKNNIPNMIILHDKLLSELEYKDIDECYDKNAFKYDISFTCWKSNYSIDIVSKAFRMIPSNGTSFEAEKSRSEYLYFCKYQGKCYELIAGYNCDNNLFPHLKYMKSKNFKTLNKLEELCDYLGGVIWYQHKTFDSEHIISTATMPDFEKELRSSKRLPAAVNAGSKGSLNLIDVDWIGIIDICDPQLLIVSNVLRSGYGSASNINVKYNKLHLNEFEIISGKIICIDPGYNWKRQGVQFGDVAIGKWFWKIKHISNGRRGQLLAYHESVMNDNIYKDECVWKVEKEIYEHSEELKEYLDLDDIEKAEKQYEQFMSLLKKYVKNVNNDIIILIAEYCYFVKNVNWIEKRVINNEWYLHRYGVGVDSGRAGIFDYDKFGDCSYIDDPYKNVNGYDWYSFKEKGSWPCDNLFEEYVNQSLSDRDPCSLQYGCVGTSGYGDGCYACLAKIDVDTCKVVAIRLVFVDDL